MQHLILHIGQGSTEISKINENLFDKNNYIKIYDGQVNSSGVINTSDARHKTLLIECRPNVELSAYIKNKNNSYSRLLSCFDEEPVVGETEATATSTSPNGLHITTTSNTKYLAIYLGATFDKNWVSVQDIIDSVMLVKGNVSLTSKDYVEHKQSNYILNIQQEMLQGDYFVKETDGWKEVHNWTKIDSYNSESITTDYISTTGELTTGATIYYKLATPTKLLCTEAQSAVLDELNNLDLFRPVTNIITTEDIALLKLKYVVDTKTYVDNQIADMQNQLNTINELLSTTATSSILLDNLQTDLESEVM